MAGIRYALQMSALTPPLSQKAEISFSLFGPNRFVMSNVSRAS